METGHVGEEQMKMAKAEEQEVVDGEHHNYHGHHTGHEDHNDHHQGGGDSMGGNAMGGNSMDY